MKFQQIDKKTYNQNEKCGGECWNCIDLETPQNCVIKPIKKSVEKILDKEFF